MQHANRSSSAKKQPAKPHKAARVATGNKVSKANPEAQTDAAKTGAASSPHAIRLRGVRQNNLKDFDLDLPLGRLIVVTGLSGSGKSSLVFDTVHAEGQRRYV